MQSYNVKNFSINLQQFGLFARLLIAFGVVFRSRVSLTDVELDQNITR